VSFAAAAEGRVHAHMNTYSDDVLLRSSGF
jgi:hypothetical protein